jgi:hypothetical protein
MIDTYFSILNYKNFVFTITVMKRSFEAILFFFILTLTFAGNAVAASNRGIEYQDDITIDGKVLSLEGIGLLKWKFFVNVYLVGFYKPENVPVAQVLENIPKRLEYYFFVDMKASDFQDTGFQLMADNVGEDNAIP